MDVVHKERYSGWKKAFYYFYEFRGFLTVLLLVFTCLAVGITVDVNNKVTAQEAYVLKHFPLNHRFSCKLTPPTADILSHVSPSSPFVFEGCAINHVSFPLPSSSDSSLGGRTHGPLLFEGQSIRRMRFIDGSVVYSIPEGT